MRRAHSDPGHFWLLGALLFVACADVSGDDASFPIDPSFDHWCDQHLCDWQIDQGKIEQTGTWHKLDLAVSFVATPTTISQSLKHGDDASPCILFDTVADVAPEALVSVVIDFNDDGIPDVEQKIAALRWQRVPFVVRAPVAYDGFRLSVIKQGTGRAVLAQMRVLAQASCGDTPFTLAADSKCSQNEVCTSGRCEQGRCVPCAEGSCTSLTPARGSE